MVLHTNLALKEKKLNNSQTKVDKSIYSGNLNPRDLDLSGVRGTQILSAGIEIPTQ